MCCTALAAVSQTQKPSVSKTLSYRLPHSTFLDLTTQADAPDDAWEAEITGWDPRSTRDPSSSSSFWPHQPDATSRLGPDLVPPSRPVRVDDEMSVQEHETTHVPFTHPAAGETIPSEVPVTSVEPEDSSADNVHESHQFQTSSTSVGPSGTPETCQR